MSNEDTSVIPKGMYCDDEDGKVCPFWSLLLELPEYENGYCAYLGKSDWDLNEDIDKQGGCKYMVYETGKVGIVSAHDFCCSDIWDKCKECEVNEEDQLIIVVDNEND